MDFAREVAVNEDGTMPTRDSCIVDHDIVVRKPAHAIQTHFEGDLAAAVEKPAMVAGGFDGDIDGSKSSEVARFPQWQANIASQSMGTDRVFDAAPSNAERIAAGIPFQMHAQQAGIHKSTTFPNLMRHPHLKSLATYP